MELIGEVLNLILTKNSLFLLYRNQYFLAFRLFILLSAFYIFSFFLILTINEKIFKVTTILQI